MALHSCRSSRSPSQGPRLAQVTPGPARDRSDAAPSASHRRTGCAECATVTKERPWCPCPPDSPNETRIETRRLNKAQVNRTTVLFMDKTSYTMYAPTAPGLPPVSVRAGPNGMASNKSSKIRYAARRGYGLQALLLARWRRPARQPSLPRVRAGLAVDACPGQLSRLPGPARTPARRGVLCAARSRPS